MTALMASTQAPARADDLSRSDKLRALYSNQFAFDRRGVPLITVGIAEGLRQVVIEGAAPPRVWPDGEGGSEVLGGKRWRVSIGRARAAKVEYFAVLGRHLGTNMKHLRQQVALWKQRGIKAGMMEVGAVFGVKGRVFDNRAYLLTQGPYPTRALATSAARRQDKRHGLAKVHAVARLTRRPTARFEARDLAGTTRVRFQDAIWFAPSDGKRLRVVVPGGKPRAYVGQVYVTVDRNGRLAVVNAVPADNMLAGLVPAEIFPSAPLAALRAQAVAARGELLAKIGTRHLEDPYLLCSTVHCQVYAGAGHEHPRTTSAITATRGLVLMRKDGHLVDTVYSAVCGGHTEHNENVWPSTPDENLRGHLDAPRGVPAFESFAGGISSAQLERWLALRGDSWCARARVNANRYRWQVTLSAAKLARLLRPLGVGRVKSIRVTRRGVSGRANLVQISGTRGVHTLRGELKIRRTLGGLNSSMFVVKPAPGGGATPAFNFVGGGWGHGVGMCQTGAIGMAKGGKGHLQILKHYYPSSTLQPLY